ncbi:MAG: hypothetical protein Q9226_009015, partial [Calogaya cf. arnoldii]
MTRASELSPTREGLLHDLWDGSQAKFHDDPYRFSGESDPRLDELEMNDDRPKQGILAGWTQQMFGRYQTAERRYKDRKDTGRGSLAGKHKARGYCSRYKIYFITTGVLLALFLIASGSGLFWVYKTAPKDGVGAPVAFIYSQADQICSNPLLGIRPREE